MNHCVPFKDGGSSKMQITTIVSNYDICTFVITNNSLLIFWHVSFFYQLCTPYGIKKGLFEKCFVQRNAVFNNMVESISPTNTKKYIKFSQEFGEFTIQFENF